MFIAYELNNRTYDVVLAIFWREPPALIVRDKNYCAYNFFRLYRLVTEAPDRGIQGRHNCAVFQLMNYIL